MCVFVSKAGTATPVSYALRAWFFIKLLLGKVAVTSLWGSALVKTLCSQDVWGD